jgi:serine/threonine protein kinase
MAPEQVEHPSEVDHRADIYALGVVFYQMLTGELPGQKIEPPSRKVHIDVRLDEVVLRALEKAPALRFQQVSVMKTQVETIASTPACTPIENVVSEPGAQPPTLQASSPFDFNPWQPVLAVLGVVICFSLFIIGFLLPFPINLVPLVVAPFGFSIAALKLAGFWPWPSPLFPHSKWTGRHLPSARKETARQSSSRRSAGRAFALLLVAMAIVALLAYASARFQAPQSNLPGIESVEIRTDVAIIRQRNSHGEGIRTHRFLPLSLGNSRKCLDS